MPTSIVPRTIPLTMSRLRAEDIVESLRQRFDLR
jgi:hypothetical protein